MLVALNSGADAPISMSIPHLSLQDARHLQLVAQGLLTPRRAKAMPADLLATIRRMALLQIDTISVVARSPYLVLFSRLGQYDPRWLEQLLAEGDIFEYWAHEACFIPREDYRLLRHRMLDPAAMGWKFSANWLATHQQEIGQIIERIRQYGPVRAADFERKGEKGNGWWDWKPEKRHLEVLFTAGQLMVRERPAQPLPAQPQRLLSVGEQGLPARVRTGYPPQSGVDLVSGQRLQRRGDAQLPAADGVIAIKNRALGPVCHSVNQYALTGIPAPSAGRR